jgi:hypothetical protein
MTSEQRDYGGYGDTEKNNRTEDDENPGERVDAFGLSPGGVQSRLYVHAAGDDQQNGKRRESLKGSVPHHFESGNAEADSFRYASGGSDAK